jgi:hypothetical protein
VTLVGARGSRSLKDSRITGDYLGLLQKLDIHLDSVEKISIYSGTVFRDTIGIPFRKSLVSEARGTTDLESIPKEEGAQACRENVHSTKYLKHDILKRISQETDLTTKKSPNGQNVATSDLDGGRLPVAPSILAFASVPAGRLFFDASKFIHKIHTLGSNELEPMQSPNNNQH